MNIKLLNRPNLFWSNASIEKPRYFIAVNEFEDYKEGASLKDLKVNWEIEKYSGQLKLKGDWNYAYLGGNFYFLEKMRSFGGGLHLYKVVYDFWCNEVLRKNVSVYGTLDKTSDMSLVGQWVHTTKPLIENPNGKRIIPIAANLTVHEPKIIATALALRSRDAYLERFDSNSLKTFVSELKKLKNTSPTFNGDLKFPLALFTWHSLRWEIDLMRKAIKWLHDNRKRLKVFDLTTTKVGQINAIQQELEKYYPSTFKKYYSITTDESRIFGSTENRSLRVDKIDFSKFEGLEVVEWGALKDSVKPRELSVSQLTSKTKIILKEQNYKDFKVVKNTLKQQVDDVELPEGIRIGLIEDYEAKTSNHVFKTNGTIRVLVGLKEDWFRAGKPTLTLDNVKSQYGNWANLEVKKGEMLLFTDVHLIKKEVEGTERLSFNPDRWSWTADKWEQHIKGILQGTTDSDDLYNRESFLGDESWEKRAILVIPDESNHQWRLGHLEFKTINSEGRSIRRTLGYARIAPLETKESKEVWPQEDRHDSISTSFVEKLFGKYGSIFNIHAAKNNRRRNSIFSAVKMELPLTLSNLPNASVGVKRNVDAYEAPVLRRAGSEGNTSKTVQSMEYELDLSRHSASEWYSHMTDEVSQWIQKWFSNWSQGGSTGTTTKPWLDFEEGEYYGGAWVWWKRFQGHWYYLKLSFRWDEEKTWYSPPAVSPGTFSNWYTNANGDAREGSGFGEGTGGIHTMIKGFMRPSSSNIIELKWFLAFWQKLRSFDNNNYYVGTNDKAPEKWFNEPENSSYRGIVNPRHPLNEAFKGVSYYASDPFNITDELRTAKVRTNYINLRELEEFSIDNLATVGIPKSLTRVTWWEPSYLESHNDIAIFKLKGINNLLLVVSKLSHTSPKYELLATDSTDIVGATEEETLELKIPAEITDPIEIVNQVNTLYVYGSKFPLKFRSSLTGTQYSFPRFNLKGIKVEGESPMEYRRLEIDTGEDYIDTVVACVKKVDATKYWDPLAWEDLKLRIQEEQRTKNLDHIRIAQERRRHYEDYYLAEGELAESRKLVRGTWAIEDRQRDLQWWSNILGGVSGMALGTAGAAAAMGGVIASGGLGAIAAGGAISSALGSVGRLYSAHKQHSLQGQLLQMQRAKQDYDLNLASKKLQYQDTRWVEDFRLKRDDMEAQHNLREASLRHEIIRMNSSVNLVQTNDTHVHEAYNKLITESEKPVHYYIIQQFPQGKVYEALRAYYKEFGCEVLIPNWVFDISLEDRVFYRFIYIHELRNVTCPIVRMELVKMFTGGVSIRRI